MKLQEVTRKNTQQEIISRFERKILCGADHVGDGVV
jgi:hypothetical protein